MSGLSGSTGRDRPTTIALYLPQFYPMPENDAWWGPGFTEWRNVVTARPLFPGHDQPRIPREFGFYDLRIPEIRDAQARAALDHGIDAFCYYHYWFEGHRPMRLVIDDVLDRDIPNIPFCLAWANENWSRHWDAASREVLLEQRYSPEDDEEHGAFLLRAMKHRLYLRVDGRPVFFIYRIQAMPNPSATLERWRQIWRDGGLPDVHIVKFDTHGNADPPSAFGADAAAMFLPHGMDRTVKEISDLATYGRNRVWQYSDVARAYLDAKAPAWTRYECVFPSWDNTPRRGDGRSFIVHASTPERYEAWLSSVRARTPANGLIILNAWNEWAEGAYLEPDLAHGAAYLEATARALGLTATPPPPLSMPVDIADTMASRERLVPLYLAACENQARLQRRLSRLEASFQRQVDTGRQEADEMRAHAVEFAQEIVRLREELAKLKRVEQHGRRA